MKSSLLALALCALSVPFAHAAPPVASAQVQPVQRPLLWKVSDADNSVYLLGAFHLLKQDDYPLPKEVDAAFDDAEVVVFEMPPAQLTDPQTQAIAKKYMAYDHGETLQSVLPKATLDKLGTLMAAGGGSVQTMDDKEPWAVSIGLVMSVSQALGYRADLGLDRHLMARAATAGKPTAGLETAEDQLRAMDAVPRAEQVKSLDEFLSEPSKAIKQLNDMHAWWRAGDVADLDSEMRADMQRKTPETYRLLNVERNRQWVPLIEKRLTDSSTDDALVVVGALHLLGSDGLVEQLRAKGYKVERICDTCVAD